MIQENKTTITLRYIARWFVGLVFLFSSFTKGVDPLGTAYKIEEYMTAWNFFGFSFADFVPLAPVLSMTLIIAEFLVGVLLLTGAFRKLTAWLLLLMMAFFTCTTLYDAISGKVSDCGCFGDFWELTNWETFWKNVVLDVPTVYIFLTRLWPRRKRLERDILISLAAIAVMLIFGIYNIKNEPVLDFRAWKVGNKMIDNIEEGLPVINIATYKNSQTGETQTFNMNEWEKYKYILYDSTDTWKVDTIITKDPYEVHADGFFAQDRDKVDMTFDLIAATQEPVLLCTIHHIDKIDGKGVEAIAEAKKIAEDKGVRFAILAYVKESETDDDAQEATILQFLYNNKLMPVDYYFGDEKAIETMLRSNPGFILMRNAVVQGKWHYNNVEKIKNFPFEEIK